MDWEYRYRECNTPWDLRQITPPLLDLLASGRLTAVGVPPRAVVAVPGCGRGHDLRALADHGMVVTGFDVVPAAVAEAQTLLRLNQARARVLCRDVLGLAGEFRGEFDLIYDYTCLCSFPPALRSAYVREVTEILTPTGFWLQLAFPMRSEAAGPAGPPYLIRGADLELLFGDGFHKVAEFPAVLSDRCRAGSERWFLFQRC